MEKKKTDLEIFQEMIDNGEDIRMSPHFISADLIKQGGKICMGVEAKAIHDLMTGDFTCALYMVNSKQFFARKNAESQSPSDQSGEGVKWEEYIEQFERLNAIWHTLPEPLKTLLRQQIDFFAQQYESQSPSDQSGEDNGDDLPKRLALITSRECWVVQIHMRLWELNGRVEKDSDKWERFAEKMVDEEFMKYIREIVSYTSHPLPDATTIDWDAMLHEFVTMMNFNPTDLEVFNWFRSRPEFKTSEAK